MIAYQTGHGSMKYIPESEVKLIEERQTGLDDAPYGIRIVTSAGEETVYFANWAARSEVLKKMIASMDRYSGIQPDPGIAEAVKQLTAISQILAAPQSERREKAEAMALMDEKVTSLRIPNTLLRALLCEKVDTVRDFLSMSRKRLMRIRHVGPKTLKAAVSAVHEKGLRFEDPEMEKLGR